MNLLKFGEPKLDSLQISRTQNIYDPTN